MESGEEARATADRLAELDQLLDHARMQWSAEEENARRLATRRGQLLTLITAMLLVGMVKVGDLDQDAGPATAMWTLRGVVIAGIAFLVLAMAHLLRVRLSKRLRGTLRRLWGRGWKEPVRESQSNPESRRPWPARRSIGPPNLHRAAKRGRVWIPHGSGQRACFA